jgi:hypothetical protein
MIIGILGFAQTGKDTVSDLLADMGFIRIAFADPLKRIVRTMFSFTYEQMWGTDEQKTAPDLRYPREHTWGHTSCLCCGVEMLTWKTTRAQCFLNPRYALKIIGTEGGRHCYQGIWGEQSLRDARKALEGYGYSREHGCTQYTGHSARGVIFTDCRFENEVERLQNAGGKVYRIKRPGYEKPMFDHPSETEQLQIPDDRLQGVIYNDGTLEDLRSKVLSQVVGV